MRCSGVLLTVDEALGHPATLDVVDVGAGRGELISALLTRAPQPVRERLAPVAVEIAPRPDGLDPAIAWLPTPPKDITGLLIATEWLDNVPLDIVERDAAGDWRYVMVADDGTESLGDAPDDDDRAWLDAWWPDGFRAEIGRARDAAWADAVACLSGGLALAVDYGHLRDTRPPLGTLTGFRDGRETAPVPDTSVDLTAHVAIDSVAAAGSAVAGQPPTWGRQADALRAPRRQRAPAGPRTGAT